MAKDAITPVQDTDQSAVYFLIQEQMLAMDADTQKKEAHKAPIAVAHHVMAAIATTNNGMLGATYNPPSTGSSGPIQPITPNSSNNSQTNGPLPSYNPPPNGGTSGCPDASWPGGGETNMNMSGYLDKLYQFMLYLNSIPNDGQADFQFLSYITTLAQHGVLNNPQVQKMLSDWNFSAKLPGMVQQAVLSAMFYGYGGSNGQQGATNFINAIEGVLQPLSGNNSYIAQMADLFNGQLVQLPAIAQEFGFANGGTGSFTYTLPDGATVTFNWAGPNSSAMDQYNIEEFINNFTKNYSPTPVSGNSSEFNLVSKDYRMSIFDYYTNSLSDPSEILCILMALLSDENSQADFSGLSATTDQLSQMTNDYASPLLSAAQNFGNMTDTQTQNFMELFYNSTYIMNTEGQLSNLSGTWNSNVYSTIANQSITITPASGSKPITTTLGALMEAASSGGSIDGDTISVHDVTNALNSLNPQGGTSAPTTNPSFQSILNSLQQAGSLITSTSNTLSTQLGTISQQDNQYLKFGSSVVDPTGGGTVQMEMQIINNQKSN